MFDFTVQHGPRGSVLAWLDVDKGPDQMTYCASFDLHDWWAPIFFSVETMIYDPANPDPDFDAGDPNEMPPGYAYTSHALHIHF